MTKQGRRTINMTCYGHKHLEFLFLFLTTTIILNTYMFEFNFFSLLVFVSANQVSLGSITIHCCACCQYVPPALRYLNRYISWIDSPVVPRVSIFPFICWVTVWCSTESRNCLATENIDINVHTVCWWATVQVGQYWVSLIYLKLQIANVIQAGLKMLRLQDISQSMSNYHINYRKNNIITNVIKSW